ncbi:MAG TPA: GyrI-like domain-containing protein [Tepidisphaeraceae bacterium]|jgi:effector-binding domain-containing protein
MNYSVRLEQIPSQPLAVVRRHASKAQLSKVIPEACGTVWNAIRAMQIKGGRHVAVYLDNEFNLEVGAEVNEPIKANGEVVPASLPAGTVATTTHFGPYSGLGDAHNAIQKWCRDNNHEPVRPCWEVYGHWDHAWDSDPSKIRTDVYYLLKS